MLKMHDAPPMEKQKPHVKYILGNLSGHFLFYFSAKWVQITNTDNMKIIDICRN
jgi:hypothetical protein